jgi:hypothetical protein
MIALWQLHSARAVSKARDQPNINSASMPSMLSRTPFALNLHRGADMSRRKIPSTESRPAAALLAVPQVFARRDASYGARLAPVPLCDDADAVHGAPRRVAPAQPARAGDAGWRRRARHAGGMRRSLLDERRGRQRCGPARGDTGREDAAPAAGW